MTDVPAKRPTPRLPLSARQLRLCRLYAEGYTLKQIAYTVGTGLASVEQGLHAAKVKYRNAGHDVHTKADVRERLIADGLLDEHAEESRVEVPLSPREEAIAVLVVAGSSIEEVSSSLGLSPEPIRQYLASVRAKYRSAGREADTDAQLGVQLEKDGVIDASRPLERRALNLTLPLSPREGLVARLFADDHTADQIALALGLTIDTVRSYVVHARLKYRHAGRDASTKLQLRARLVEDGYLQEGGGTVEACAAASP